VDGVVAEPRAPRVGRAAGRGDLEAAGALAAALDGGARGLHEDGEVGGEDGRVDPGDAAEAVEVAGDLLVVVEDPGHVVPRGRQGRGEAERHRDATLHVTAAAPVDAPVDQAAGQVVLDRDGVEVPGDRHPAGPALLGAGHDGVAVPPHREVRDGPQGGLDGVRERPLVAAHRLDVDDRAQEVDGVREQVQGHGRQRSAAARRPLGGGRPPGGVGRGL